MAFDFSTLVTDRTQQDVAYVKQLIDKLVLGTATDAEKAEWNSFTLKGAYNHTDLNRVTAAMEDLKLRLEGYGYFVPGYRRIQVSHPVIGGGSRLPEGYTELAYIQSTGTQYIDTGFKANNNTRVVADAQFVSTSSPQVLFGGRTSAGSKNYTLMLTDGVFRSNYNGTYTQTWSVGLTTKRTFDKNKETTTIDGTSQSYTNATFQCDYNLLLFALNNAGTVQWYSSVRLYSCQVYDNGTLIRDYVPCINPDGVVGLYDLVTAVFFGNSGTGQFYGFVQPVLTANGTLGGSSFAVYASNEHSATYSAYKAFGSNTSEAYSSSVNPSATPVDYVIYNPDALYLKSLKVTNVPSGLTSSSPKNVALYGSNDNSQWKLLATVTNTNNANSSTWEIESVAKEMYKYFKLHITSANTSEAYVNIGKIQLNAYVLADEPTGDVETGTDQLDPYIWYEDDQPTPEDMEQYLLNVSAIRAVLAVMASTPEVPPDISTLIVQEANNIEIILMDVYRQINIMATTFIPCGEALCGGDNL